ncbi:baseplate hub distal subunit [Acinetobacter phage Henu6]|uniref:Baseplate hub distal subunit n=1 Tax=Acinetobacter phage Henu6 TaxID=2500136 RepID=A0A410T5E6_9CAUD|nr:baseplate hub distal subunit [Acinetobacter phage Henu6]
MQGIHLNIVPETKQLNVNGKTIKVPKLGLKHRLLLKPNENHEESMKTLLASIAPNLSMAERDLLTIHLLAYNGKIPNTVIKDGHTYSIEDVYICQKLKFTYSDYEFKFRSPTFELLKGPADILLSQCCVYVKKNDEKIQVPDFMDLPPFVINWVEQITKTIAIDGPNGPIKGLYELVELFDGPTSS